MKIITKIACLLILTIIFLGVTSDVLAIGNGFDTGIYNSLENNEVDIKVSKSAQNIYASIITVIQVLSVAGVVILGVKYMFAGSSDKANIKQTLIYAVIGCVLVFGASTVVKFVIDVGEKTL